MALIKCSECQKEISDKASACPNCGNPVVAQSAIPAIQSKPAQVEYGQVVQKPNPPTKPKKKHGCLIAIAVVFGVFIIIGIIASIFPDDSDSPVEKTSSSIAESSQAPSPDSSAAPNPTPQPANTYQSILDEYSALLREAAPQLAIEFENEAQRNTGGIEGLAELSLKKTEELAKISLEGTEKNGGALADNGIW